MPLQYTYCTPLNLYQNRCFIAGQIDWSVTYCVLYCDDKVLPYLFVVEVFFFFIPLKYVGRSHHSQGIPLPRSINACMTCCSSICSPCWYILWHIKDLSTILQEWTDWALESPTLLRLSACFCCCVLYFMKMTNGTDDSFSTGINHCGLLFCWASYPHPLPLCFISCLLLKKMNSYCTVRCHWLSTNQRQEHTKNETAVCFCVGIRVTLQGHGENAHNYTNDHLT